MRTLRWITLLLCPLALADTAPELQALVRQSLEGLNRESDLREDYLFAGHNETLEFDAAGKTTQRKTSAWEMVEVEGTVLRRATERDDKPLTDAEKAIEEESLRSRAREWKMTPPDSRLKQRRSEQMAWLQEFPDALDFRSAGEEIRSGRATRIIDFEPRPGYKPRNIRARIFEKMRGRMWVDVADGEIARLEAEMFGDVNIGLGIFGKIAKGTQFSLGRRQVDEKRWMVDWQKFRFDARILLVKTIRRQEVNRFDQFRRRSIEAARIRVD